MFDPSEPVKGRKGSVPVPRPGTASEPFEPSMNMVPKAADSAPALNVGSSSE